MPAKKKPSNTDLVYETVISAGRPVTLDEVLDAVNRRQTITTRDPRATISHILSQSRLLVSVGDGRWGYLPQLLRDNVFRLVFTEKKPAYGQLTYSWELRQALWPASSEVQKRRDERPVQLALPNGAVVTLHLTYPPIVSDQGKWASALPEAMRQWLIDERAQAGDNLIIRVVDAMDARYEARLERKRERNADTVTHRNREVAEAAYQLLRRRSSSEVLVWDVSAALIARGFYRAQVPPDPLETILAADSRFVDAGWHTVVLAEDITPELEDLIRRRKEPWPAFVEPATDEVITRRDAISLRRSSEKALVDIGRALSEQQFDSMEEANAWLQEMISTGGPRSTRPMTPLEQAQDIMFEAWDAETPRERVKLARKALQVSPDCADAYVLLAEEIGRSLEDQARLYAEGVAAGERALGPTAFKEQVGEFWGIIETRPYMRARAGLAECLWQLGQHEEAVAHYLDMLRLNPGDNLGLRYVLLPALLEMGRRDDVKKLLHRYRSERDAQWLYGHALYTFMTEGDSPAARRRISEAIRSNPHVPIYLLGAKRIPTDMPEHYSWGGESEAIICADLQTAAWRNAPGALAWLAKQR